MEKKGGGKGRGKTRQRTQDAHGHLIHTQPHTFAHAHTHVQVLFALRWGGRTRTDDGVRATTGRGTAKRTQQERRRRPLTTEKEKKKEPREVREKEKERGRGSGQAGRTSTAPHLPQVCRNARAPQTLKQGKGGVHINVTTRIRTTTTTPPDLVQTEQTDKTKEKRKKLIQWGGGHITQTQEAKREGGGLAVFLLLVRPATRWGAHEAGERHEAAWRPGALKVGGKSRHASHFQNGSVFVVRGGEGRGEGANQIWSAMEHRERTDGRKREKGRTRVR